MWSKFFLMYFNKHIMENCQQMNIFSFDMAKATAEAFRQEVNVKKLLNAE